MLITIIIIICHQRKPLMNELKRINTINNTTTTTTTTTTNDDAYYDDFDDDDDDDDANNDDDAAAAAADDNTMGEKELPLPTSIVCSFPEDFLFYLFFLEKGGRGGYPIISRFLI